MAIGMLQEFKRMTEKDYDRVVGLLDLKTNPPKGALFHAAGPTASGGWRVFDVWESNAAWEQFLNGRLLPAFKKANLSEEPQTEIYPIHNLMSADYAELQKLRTNREARA